MSNYDFDLVWARMRELEKRISALEADSPREPRKLHRTDGSVREMVANHARLKDLLPMLTGAKGSSSALRGLGALLENWYARCAAVGAQCTRAQLYPDIFTYVRLVWAGADDTLLYVELPEGAANDLERLEGYVYRGKEKFPFKGLAAFRAHATEFFDLPQERVEEPKVAPTAPAAFDGLVRALRASAGTPDASRLVEAVLKGLEKPLRGLPVRFGEPEVQWCRAGLRHALHLTWHWKSGTYRLRVEPQRRGARWDLAWCVTDNGVFASSRLDCRKDVLQVLRDAFVRETAGSAAP